ncbi:hypothetical protein FH972_014302 [Carpinus fangiana]|uniref:Uncharacterized protein n=1 Tax=Carpinus fangiana TaxID=176857 RepID=A0A5N6RB64_9ROSI|nr:hypothetical protein FH972_014302 [Carpinus fangiana]
MELEKETATAEERRSMASINDSETLPTGVSAASKRKSLSSKQKEYAFNACSDSNAQWKERSVGSMGRKIVSYVDNMDLVPPQGKIELHMPSNLDEPDYSNTVSLPIHSQSGLRPKESQAMQKKQVSSWKRRARGSQGSSIARDWAIDKLKEEVLELKKLKPQENGGRK